MELIKAIDVKLIQTGQTASVAVTLATEHGFIGTSMIPQGVTVGAQEAKSVSNEQALATITNVLTPMLVGKDVLEQRELDQLLMDADATADRHHLGYNALLPLSIAATSAAAATLGKPLYSYIAELTQTQPTIPQPVIVMIEGGGHAPQSNFPLQEISVIAPYDQAIIYNKHLESTLRNHSIQFGYGIEGGVTVNNLSTDQVLALVKESTQTAPLAVDCAASHKTIDPATLHTLLSDPRINIIEDPTSQDNHASWQELTAAYGQQKTIAADDLTVGDPKRIKDALTGALANCLVIKLNQTGTLSELLDLIAFAQMGNWSHMVSGRGHETMDTFIADLAVGTGAKYLKAGNPRRPERFAKYQRLKNINQELAT